MRAYSQDAKHREAVAWMQKLEALLKDIPEGADVLFNPNGQQLVVTERGECERWHAMGEDAPWDGPRALAITEPVRMYQHPQA